MYLQNLDNLTILFCGFILFSTVLLMFFLIIYWSHDTKNLEYNVFVYLTSLILLIILFVLFLSLLILQINVLSETDPYLKKKLQQKVKKVKISAFVYLFVILIILAVAIIFKKHYKGRGSTFSKLWGNGSIAPGKSDTLSGNGILSKTPNVSTSTSVTVIPTQNNFNIYSTIDVGKINYKILDENTAAIFFAGDYGENDASGGINLKNVDLKIPNMSVERIDLSYDKIKVTYKADDGRTMTIDEDHDARKKRLMKFEKAKKVDPNVKYTDFMKKQNSGKISESDYENISSDFEGDGENAFDWLFKKT